MSNTSIHHGAAGEPGRLAEGILIGMAIGAGLAGLPYKKPTSWLGTVVLSVGVSTGLYCGWRYVRDRKVIRYVDKERKDETDVRLWRLSYHPTPYRHFVYVDAYGARYDELSAKVDSLEKTWRRVGA